MSLAPVVSLRTSAINGNGNGHGTSQPANGGQRQPRVGAGGGDRDGSAEGCDRSPTATACTPKTCLATGLLVIPARGDWEASLPPPATKQALLLLLLLRTPTLMTLHPPHAKRSRHTNRASAQITQHAAVTCCER